MAENPTKPFLKRDLRDGSSARPYLDLSHSALLGTEKDVLAQNIMLFDHRESDSMTIDSFLNDPVDPRLGGTKRACLRYNLNVSTVKKWVQNRRNNKKNNDAKGCPFALDHIALRG